MKSKNIFLIVLFLSFITYNLSLAQAPAWLSVKDFKAASLSNCKSDKDGNIYACGRFSDSIKFDSIELKSKTDSRSMYIVKFSPEGKALWAKTTDIDSGPTIAKTLTVDYEGNIYVIGVFGTPGCIFEKHNLKIIDPLVGQDIFIIKYNPDGEIIWIRSAGGECGSVEPWAAVVDSKGDVYIAGCLQAQYILLDTIKIYKISKACRDINFDLFIAKFSADGKALWGKVAGNGKIAFNWAHGIAIDKQDNVFLTRYFDADYISFDTITLKKTKTEQLYIAKFNSKGKTLWAKTENTNSSAFFVTTDTKDNCYIIGHIRSDSLIFGKDTLYGKTNFNACVLKYDSDGNQIWGRAANKYSAISVYSVTTDSLDNVYAGGWFVQQPFAYDTVTVPCDKGIYITKYDSSGKFNWVKCIEADGKLRALHYDKFGNIYVAGYFVDTARFDTLTIPQIGTSQFIAKLAPSLFTTIKSVPEPKTDLFLYPNPCTDELTINVSHFGNVKHLITVYDIHGKAIFQTQSPHNAQTQITQNAQTTISINTRSFPPGLYLTRIQSPNSTTTRKFIKF
ncbi:MAG: T9SS type A sorting domain-containing protein [Bacteroidales bacterium]|nr:T9SS type A sorting domain-containing protein [Bacteroidales bacterium]